MDIEYELTPINKGDFFTTEEWHITISTGKNVILLYTQCWNNGTFNITANESDINEILKLDHIIINDHGGCINMLEMGWYFSDEIKKFDTYTEEEVKEINMLKYVDMEDNNNLDEDYDEGDVDTCRLEDNGWTLEETIYEVYNGIELA